MRTRSEGNKRLSAVIAVVLAMTANTAHAADAVVAAASDLKFALEAIAEDFQHDTGHRLKLTFGSSGILSTQIRNGAPFELFLSADEDYVLKLHAQGLTRDQGVLYAVGRIVLIAGPRSTLPVDSELKGLLQQLDAGTLGHFAIANPDHAPYGRRAAEALRHAGAWEAIEPLLVYGENVSQAAQFAVGGAAVGGIVALSLVMSPKVAGGARYAVIPEDWHSPLRQRMVLMRSAGPGAEALFAYLQQPAARALMRRFGFTLPDDPD
jgi:molybdate transport system substrate-binding protein